MWARLGKQIAVEREQLNHLLETHRSLLAQCASTPPNSIELSALAAMLHSFYTGIEHIFKRIAAEVDRALPRGESWHRELLEAMARSANTRRAAISPTLRDQVREYIEFRHVFREAYSFQLQWEKMAHLVLGCEKTLKALETELDIFLQSGAEGSRMEG